MDQKVILWTILGMAAVTYLPRLLPAWLLASRSFNPNFERWLGFVPAAILGALLAPALLAPQGAVDVSWDNLHLLAALPAGLAAWRTKNLFAAVAAGMATLAALRWVLG